LGDYIPVKNNFGLGLMCSPENEFRNDRMWGYGAGNTEQINQVRSNCNTWLWFWAL